MLTLLAALGLILDLTTRIMDAFRRHLVQPVITAFLLAITYAALHITQEGTVADGLRSAFWDRQASLAERGRSDHEDALQVELHHFACVNKLIDQHLQTLLMKSAASRVRLAVIHNGVTGLTGTGLLRYDVTNAAAAPGRSTGDLLQNAPLADWRTFCHSC